MLKNIYSPLSGGLVQERVLEILANNVANMNTTGFKEEQISFAAMEANPWNSYPSALPPAQFKLDMRNLYPLHGNEMGYVTLANVETSHIQGGLKRTGVNTDVAVQGDGFFAVNTPFGERYTRDGSFSLTPDGTLVTKNGASVAGERGAITGLSEGDMKILPTGEVYNGDKFIDKIKVVAFSDKKLLQRLGDNLFVHDGAPENIVAHNGQVTQGHIENSNVNPMKNMSNMIIAHRTYEALQKAVKAYDNTMQLSAQKVGEVG
ncbi:MAG: flagellar basal-body rod protein FlgF [Proteobacteria bacterium]|nr:flagellar basal-body rod protein FlgF [Pseudomonadota bacterium]